MSTRTDLPSDSRAGGEGLVVTENGIRRSGTVHTTSESAQSEAATAKSKTLRETGDGAAPKVEVKQQIFG